MKQRMIRLFVFMICLILFVGCNSTSTPQENTPSAQSEPNTEAPVTNEPAEEPEPEEVLEDVTLHMYQTQSYWTEEQVEKLIQNPVKEKYPHITIEFDRNLRIDEALATGMSFDLIAVWNGLLPEYADLQLFEDITPLAEKHGMDLDRFDPHALEAVKRSTVDNVLYALPNMVQFDALYYNMDIFDMFGVDYPEDGMTYDEMLDLARQVTRTEDSISYFGWDPDYLTRLMFPLALNVVDGADDTANVESEPYRKVFQLGKQIFDIPGNRMPGTVMTGNVVDRFMKDKNIAMLTTYNLFDRFQNLYESDVELPNWDVAQNPYYEERPNVYGTYDLHLVTVSQVSKHKDDAFRVLEVLFSDEVQMLSSSIGKPVAMKDPKFNEAFLADVPEFADKNIQSIFKSSPAKDTPIFSRFYASGRGILVSKFREYVDGTVDLNTALRQAQEEITQMIQAELQ